ncbi:MAG: hypothetical protein F2840_12740 [Actinobacteria bacterium]|nr:hypothetical protein [Actinomycetota bacterium]
MNEHAFQRLTITEPSATVAAHPAGDRHAPSTQASWGAIRMTALLAEAVIAMAASPAGYDAILGAGATTTRAAAKAAAGTARASRRTAAVIAMRIAAGINRIHGPSGTASATATAADASMGVLGQRCCHAATRAGARIHQAASSPEVRTATTATANAARIILTVNRFTSGVLVTQVAGRSAVAGRIAKASTNPWILLGTVAASFVIATGVAVIRTAAATPAPVTSPTPAPSTEPVTSPTPALSAAPVTSSTPARPTPARPRPARKATVSRKPAAGRTRSQGPGKRKAA